MTLVDGVLERPVDELCGVGATDPSGVNLQDDLAGLRARVGDVLDVQLGGPVVHRCRASCLQFASAGRRRCHPANSGTGSSWPLGRRRNDAPTWGWASQSVCLAGRDVRTCRNAEGVNCLGRGVDVVHRRAVGTPAQAVGDRDAGDEWSADKSLSRRYSDLTAVVPWSRRPSCRPRVLRPSRPCPRSSTCPRRRPRRRRGASSPTSAPASPTSRPRSRTPDGEW